MKEEHTQHLTAVGCSRGELTVVNRRVVEECLLLNLLSAIRSLHSLHVVKSNCLWPVERCEDKDANTITHISIL